MPNIHPIFVHFPIALLTLYAFSELLYFKKVRELPYIFYSKAIVLIAGSLSTFVALQTGDWASHDFNTPSLRHLIEIHSTWASITTAIFAVLAACYLVNWLNRSLTVVTFVAKRTWTQKLWIFLVKVQHSIIETPLVIVFALAGLVAVTVTGALGGSLVYGPDADPIVHFIYGLLVK